MCPCDNLAGKHTDSDGIDSIPFSYVFLLLFSDSITLNPKLVKNVNQKG